MRSAMFGAPAASGAGWLITLPHHRMIREVTVASGDPTFGPFEMDGQG